MSIYGSQYGSSHGSQYGSQNYGHHSQAPPLPGQQPGSYNQYQPQYQQSGPPPGADPQLWQWFSAVDADRSGSISVPELKTALVNGNWTSFDLDTVKMLMGIFDTDRSGTINFTGMGHRLNLKICKFAGLWKYISDWQNVFRHFDRDRSGSIEGQELAEALRSFGYSLSPSLIMLVERKYASEATTGYGPPLGITFDRFVRACVVVKTLTEAFQRVDTDRDGWAQLSYEQFMSIVLSAP